MLITFKCKAYANITMFGEVGERMLELMGFGKRVPGAISARDVGQALQNLRDGLAAIPEMPASTNQDEDDDELDSPRLMHQNGAHAVGQPAEFDPRESLGNKK